MYSTCNVIFQLAYHLCTVVLFMYLYFQPNKHVENYINNKLYSLLTLELKALKMMDIGRKSLGHLSDHRQKPMFTRITFKRSLTD